MDRKRQSQRIWGVYPLTAPAVRPATIRRWKISTRAISGTVTTTAAALIVLVLIFQRRIVAGLTAGAVKG